MAEKHKQKAKHYRLRAEEMFALASTINDPKLRDTLRGVAAEYVAMAEMMDEVAKLGGKPQL